MNDRIKEHLKRLHRYLLMLGDLISTPLDAHSRYNGMHYDLSFWRLSSGIEVDFVLGQGSAAIEAKGKPRITGPRRLSGQAKPWYLRNPIDNPLKSDILSKVREPAGGRR